MKTTKQAPRPPPDPPGTRHFSATFQPRGRPWDPAELALLGTASDGSVAARLGRTRRSIILKRRELGIPAGARRGRPHGPRQNGTNLTAEK